MGSKADAKRVLIAAGLADGEEASFITLPDPKTGQPSMYLLGGGLLQEINWVKSQFSSWFVGDAVLQDGGMYVCTPVDPLFVALPLLERARGQRQGGTSSSGEGMFCDLEQILQDVEHSAAQQLTSLLALQLPCLCDCKSAGGQDYFRLNDGKVLAWLAHKVGQAKAALLACPSAPTYAAMEEAALTAYAAGMLGEYLSVEWGARLAKALGLPEEGAAGASGAGAGAGKGQQQQAGYQGYHAAPAVDSDLQRAEKRPKLDPKEAAKQKAAEARAAAKSAKLAKEASTMRKLSSFFTPRPAAGK